MNQARLQELQEKYQRACAEADKVGLELTRAIANNIPERVYEERYRKALYPTGAPAEKIDDKA